MRRQHELLDGSRRQEPGHGVGVKGEGPARSACVVIDLKLVLFLVLVCGRENLEADTRHIFRGRSPSALV